ncbi:MAG: L-serine ammonia-lyase, iron-sulfur-dependent, subunit alpha [Rikenellaceae bacterium]
MNSSDRSSIIKLLKCEVIPAIGCTEPIAVAFAVARATELVGCEPQQLVVELSANVLKNAMGVGIPSTGMTGLPIAIALGATVGRADLGLEVLREVTPEAVEYAKGLIAAGSISISLCEDAPDKLYIKVCASGGDHSAQVVIATGHTNIIFESLDGETLLDRAVAACDQASEATVELTMRRVYDFAMESPLEELDFILDSKHLNLAAAQTALDGIFGHNVGRMMQCDKTGSLFGQTTFTKILSYTSAACDARMAGAMIPVMSNSGSGNQGIAATLPVVVYAEEHGATEEQLIRALTLSHLTVIYLKERLGRLSAMCGCVVAATGSSCGVTYLMGGTYTQITYAVKNMIANLTGIICDGAKPSCSLKISSGVSTAIISAAMALENRCVSSVEGIIDDDIEQCVDNLTTIGSDAMQITDQYVLNIMTSKSESKSPNAPLSALPCAF